MKTDALLNAYIDLNLLVLAAALLWRMLRVLLRRSRLAAAYGPQLQLLNGMTVLLVITPFLMLGLHTSGLFHPPTLSDVLVAQYLHGNFDISAARFETLIGLREDLVRSLSSGKALWSLPLAACVLTGAGASAWVLARAIWRLHRNLSRAYIWKNIGRVSLRISDTAAVAYSTRGLRRLYVVLPTHVLTNPRDLRLTLAHEMQHFRQRDIETALVLEALRPLLFWNPAYYLWRQDMRELREFACDQALSARPHFDIRAYCECLIRAAARARRASVYLCDRAPSVALLEPRETAHAPVLTRRILAVTTPLPTSAQPVVWAGISVSLAALVVLTAILMQRPGDWSHDRLMLSTIVNLERMADRRAAQPLPSDPLGGAFTASQ